MTKESARIEQARSDVRFYRESLTGMLATTDNKRLIALIESTLQSVNRIEADPLLYAGHGRRRPDLLSRWLATIEERLSIIEADYKILIHWLEHHNSLPAARSAEQGFVRLEPAVVKILDTLVGDRDKIFLTGLVLTASPVITAWFLHPYVVLYLMGFGLLCAVGGLLAGQIQLDSR